MTILKTDYQKELQQRLDEIKELYLEDNNIPWIVGYSGGKDSTAVLQLIWMALADLRRDQRKRIVHVISTDTLVENPVVSAWVDNSLKVMKDKASREDLPIHPKKLTPNIKETFWVNLIGKGYPAPKNQFRWCTDRLKIKPVSTFVKEMSDGTNEAIIVLGTRKAESKARANRINNIYEKRKVTDLLTPHNDLVGSYIYSPIVEWSNDDVWIFLMQEQNPWGHNNKALLELYSGATEGGECPLVIDTSTPSCGDSRFGCWVCTIVAKDKSMSAMITNDTEKAWMEPLLDLRNELDEHDHDKRDYRRLNGTVNLKKTKEGLVPGPYTQKSRETWLRKLLKVQFAIQNGEDTPEEVRDIKLISNDELVEIRRIWVVEKYEIEDNVPKIYEEILKKPFFIEEAVDNTQPFKIEDMKILKSDVCKDDDVKFSTLRELMEIERRYRTSSRRNGIIESLTNAIKKGFYESEQDAFDFVLSKKKLSKPIDELKEKNTNEFIEAVNEAEKNIEAANDAEKNL
ncbi:DNA phosphorothioation system sulfurtransferase DndC [Paracoccaceae bacterium]|nr:DNA phosphorothioation system sulfurtransferase DndC [Paracoccaceae bacterium]